MTLTVQHPRTPVWGKKVSETSCQRNVRTAQALKRYLDLTLTGTKKNLAQHGRTSRKGNPPSPYTFDKPEVESAIVHALQSKPVPVSLSKTPGWINEINEKICNHNGEAPMFTEKFLPMSKQEQRQPPDSRPLSGVSTKSAPVIIDGEMYYRPSRKHTFLQASNRPASAKESRLNRASKLREKHRCQSMSSVPSNDTKLQLKRMKDMKPKPLHLNKDLMPIPCHTGETPHSFIIGARYNCSHFMDSRSYARLGLYVPRQNPLRTFLKIYKGEEAYADAESDSDFVGHTSVKAAGSSGKLQFESSNTRLQPQVNPPHVRKVVKEAWLNSQENSNTELAPKPRRSFVAYSRQSNSHKSPKPKFYEGPSTTPRSEKKTPINSKSQDKFNVQGQHMTSSPDGTRGTDVKVKRTPSSTQSSGKARKKQSIEAIVPSAELA
uniref:Uncharacterized protein LOC100182232 n=1 Tax=Phallusia mammillata TaxID=59560 RepID=A0A6F9DII2_9ASCI|nr:uncharacterized protein LOC100182232 [Phallusia mammillata]